ncbi:MAG TPA: cytochrome c oxidase subunit II [Stellaceae bacterium]|nr:cytochrome c oxidase subunit II [Stellaceae bacterium]
MSILIRLLSKRVAARALLVLLAAIATALAAPHVWASGPQPWEMDFRPPATPVMQRLVAFHNELLVITFAIATFVLGLLLYVIVRFSHRRNPVPSRTSHNTVIEMLWTIVPVLILVVIAIPSFKLMYYMDKAKNPQMTIKATGHQWYWTYEYPDQGKLSFDSNMVRDASLKPGQERLLTADNPLVVPVDTTIQVLVTSTDVIHSWFVPEFGVQEYGVPGRVNESWFRIERPGTYYGQCNQLCGINHAYMPIEIHAVSKNAFQSWLKGAKQKFAAAARRSRLRLVAVATTPGASGQALAGIRH